MTSGGKPLWQDIRRWLPGVLISLAAIVIVLRLAKWEDLAVALGAIQPLNITIAALLTILSLLIRAAAWQILLEGNVSFWRTFFIINIGYLLNNIFPLRAGEIGRVLMMGNASQKGPFYVLSTIVIERALDITMAGSLLAASLPFALGVGANWAFPVTLTTLSLTLTGFLVLYLMTRNRERLTILIQRLGDRSVLLKKWIVPQMDALLSGLSILTNVRQFISCVLWIVLCWFVYLLIFYVLLIQVQPDSPFWWAVFGQSVVALGIAVPSAPGALGVYEASTVGAMKVLGVSASTALVFALIMHLLTYLVTGIFGFWGLAREGRSLGKLFEEIRLRQIVKKST